MLAIFLLWLASIIAVSCVAIRENVGDKFRTKRRVLEQVFQSEIVIDGDTTTPRTPAGRLRRRKRDRGGPQDASTSPCPRNPSTSPSTRSRANCGSTPTAGRSRSKPPETDDEAPVTIRRETDAADSAKSCGSAARSGKRSRKSFALK